MAFVPPCCSLRFFLIVAFVPPPNKSFLGLLFTLIFILSPLWRSKVAYNVVSPLLHFTLTKTTPVKLVRLRKNGWPHVSMAVRGFEPGSPMCGIILGACEERKKWLLTETKESKRTGEQGKDRDDPK